MNFKVERDIESRVFSTKVSFASLGSETMTPDEEAKMFDDFNFPVIDVGGSFAGKFKVEDDKVVLSEDLDAQVVKFVLNSNKVTVDEKFQAEFRINIDKIDTIEVGPILDDKIKIAEAKCLLFEVEIEKRIREQIESIKSKLTSFENGYPKEFTV